MGGVVRGASGTLSFGFMEGKVGGSPMFAEILALKASLTLLWDMGLRDVICEANCLEIVTVIHHQRGKFHEFASDFQEVQQFLMRDWRIQLLHISRDANMVADCLAHLGSDSQCMFTLLEDPPSQLNLILARDLLAL
ncbi:uncharacterized protein LOC130737004 [Lotus japonicus]|uniref:uncharacterized protein LOC130737004 n=1 Tax=Lotus japonicus TaxID=34305 RepID=UPI0025883699|nr:uncharacterized protein LOC130737004 [Lotus japonicus]